MDISEARTALDRLVRYAKTPFYKPMHVAVSSDDYLFPSTTIILPCSFLQINTALCCSSFFFASFFFL